MSSEYKIKVGLNIKKYREKAELTQKQLGIRLGLSEGNISKYEAGDIKRVDIETVMEIAKVLSCEPDDITGWKLEERLTNKNELHLSETEKQIIIAYRKADEIGKAVVLRSLGIDEENISKNKTKPKVG